MSNNKLAAQILKAEMLGDLKKVQQLKKELNSLTEAKSFSPEKSRREQDSEGDCHWRQKSDNIWDRINRPCPSRSITKDYRHSYKVKKFLALTGSLEDKFDQEKRVTSSDEMRMFMKTAAKFSREDMDTNQFSEELDDSQAVLKKTKRRKYDQSEDFVVAKRDMGISTECRRCLERLPKHLVIDKNSNVYMTLMDAKPLISSMSNVILSNVTHTKFASFVSASHEIQKTTEDFINSLREMWKSKGYKCLIMETYLRSHRSLRFSYVSSEEHFQVHCIPIKEKYYERSRMGFKHALQSCEEEWSMNRKLLATDERLIQKILPKGLSYFWICFDELTNGFGHVIEDEKRFSQYFGLEVLSGLLDKEFNPKKLNEREEYRNQFDRSRDFKLLYSGFKLKR